MMRKFFDAFLEGLGQGLGLVAVAAWTYVAWKLLT